MTVPIMIPNAVHICLARGEFSVHSQTTQNSKPNVPHHDQSAADGWRSTLGGIDGNGGGFRADPETKDETRDEQVPPRVRKALPETSDEGDERGDKDGSPPPEVLVQWRREPAADNTAAELHEAHVRSENRIHCGTREERMNVRMGHRSRGQATTGCCLRPGECQSVLGKTSSRR